MNHVSKKRKALFVSLGVLLAGLLLAAALWAPAVREGDAIRAAVTGIYETQAQMGSFRSPDGRSGSLPQEELDQLAADFDAKVDRCYAQGTYCNTFYKWLNRDCLFRSHQNEVDVCLAGGVSQCDLTGITLSRDGTEATVSATVTTWNKWVTQGEDGCYTVSHPVNRDQTRVKLVKEDGLWKLAETLSFDKGQDGFDPAAADPDAAVPEEIRRSEAILSATYDSYQAARDAVLSIDVEKGNYFALGG